MSAPIDDWDNLIAASDAANKRLGEQVLYMIDSGLWPAPWRLGCGETTETARKAA